MTKTYLKLKNFKTILEKLLPFPLSNNQHDSHEILINVLNYFHSGLRKQNPKSCIPKIKSSDNIEKYADMKWKEYHKREQYSIINTLFKGQSRTKVTCQECYTENNTFDSFIDLTLPINDDTSSLQDCIEDMLCPEEIDDYFCDNCKKSVRAEKESLIWIFPKFFIFHINRFNYDSTKNNRRIKYPTKCLKLKNFAERNPDVIVYNIRSIIQHHGQLIDTGHYTSTIFTNQFPITISDEELNTCKPDDESLEFPYILLYEKE